MSVDTPTEETKAMQAMTETTDDTTAMTTAPGEYDNWTATSATPGLNPKDRALMLDLEANDHGPLLVDAAQVGGTRGASCLRCGYEVPRGGRVDRSCTPMARRVERLAEAHVRWPDVAMSELIEAENQLAEIRRLLIEGREYDR